MAYERLRINSLFTFIFNKRFFYDGVYNKYITEKILKLGYHLTYALFDKGIIEYYGPQLGVRILACTTYLSRGSNNGDLRLGLRLQGLGVLIAVLFFSIITYKRFLDFPFIDGQRVVLLEVLSFYTCFSTGCCRLNKIIVFLQNSFYLSKNMNSLSKRIFLVVFAWDGSLPLPKTPPLKDYILPHRDIFFWNTWYTHFVQFIIDKFFFFSKSWWLFF